MLGVLKGVHRPVLNFGSTASERSSLVPGTLSFIKEVEGVQTLEFATPASARHLEVVADNLYFNNQLTLLSFYRLSLA